MVRIQVLGLGNSRHRRLSSNLRYALEAAGMHAKVEQVTEVDEILRFKVSAIPAILLDGQVLVENGNMPTVEELRELLAAAAAAAS